MAPDPTMTLKNAELLWVSGSLQLPLAQLATSPKHLESSAVCHVSPVCGAGHAAPALALVSEDKGGTASNHQTAINQC